MEQHYVRTCASQHNKNTLTLIYTEGRYWGQSQPAGAVRIPARRPGSRAEQWSSVLGSTGATQHLRRGALTRCIRTPMGSITVKVILLTTQEDIRAQQQR